MGDTPGKDRKRLWYGLLSTALAAVLLYYALRGVEWARVWTTITHARWQYLGAACLVTSFSFFLRSYRWRILLNTDAHFDVPTVFVATMAGYLGNSFLPARAGELVRTYIISSRSSLSKTYVLTTALSERTVDAIALVLASSIVLLGVNPKPAWLGDVSRTTALVAGAGLLGIAILPHTGDLVERLLRRVPMPSGLRNRLLELAAQILLGLRTFHSPKRLAGFAFWTVAVWSLDCVTVMVGAHALGLDLPFRVALLLLAGLGLGSALPSTPGYVGIYQFVTVSVLVPFGVSHDHALAYSFVFQAMGYIVVLILGLPALYHAKDWRQAIAEAAPIPHD
ncbi:MAG: lysylphosphatidylglycerol synthase transmembrane domain-containing protein [Candidatus Solibacter sp.]|nr:lysylphosphatidylglycerol synthase transmembrane domain-containing protein [Candidatus Solibacter sp.]